MSSPLEFQVGGVDYRSTPLDAIKQLHVVRRLTPLLKSLQGVDLAALQPAPGAAAGEAPAGFDTALAAIVGPMTEAIAAMSDADTEYVLGTCLSVVQMKEAGGVAWSPVWNRAAKCPQFDFINLPVMLQIVVKVLVANVGGFTSALPRTGPAGVALT